MFSWLESTSVWLDAGDIHNNATYNNTKNLMRIYCFRMVRWEIAETTHWQDIENTVKCLHKQLFSKCVITEIRKNVLRTETVSSRSHKSVTPRVCPTQQLVASWLASARRLVRDQLIIAILSPKCLYCTRKGQSGNHTLMDAHCYRKKPMEWCTCHYLKSLNSYLACARSKSRRLVLSVRISD